MKKKILIIALIFAMVFLAACSTESDEENEENEEEIGSGEENGEEEESDSDDEDNSDQEESDDEDADEDQNDEEDEENDNGEDEEESTTDGNLEKFYGLWEMEEDESTSDTMFLEVGLAEAEDGEEEAFEYIRFGYENSEYFPMEEIIEIEARDSEDTYYIVTAYVEEEGEDGTSEEGSGDESHYIIELQEEDELVLRYIGDDQETEMRFIKEPKE